MIYDDDNGAALVTYDAPPSPFAMRAVVLSAAIGWAIIGGALLWWLA